MLSAVTCIVSNGGIELIRLSRVQLRLRSYAANMCAMPEPKGLSGSLHPKGQDQDPQGPQGPLQGRAREVATASRERARAGPDLQRIAEARTPGCSFSVSALWERRRCILTIGSEDLRVYVAYHKPPTVFPLSHLRLRWGSSHLELSRTNWTTKLLRHMCCCEPLTMVLKLKRSQVGSTVGLGSLMTAFLPSSALAFMSCCPSACPASPYPSGRPAVPSPDVSTNGRGPPTHPPTNPPNVQPVFSPEHPWMQTE